MTNILWAILIIIFALAPFIIDKKFSNNITYGKNFYVFIPTAILILDYNLLILSTKSIEGINYFFWFNIGNHWILHWCCLEWQDLIIPPIFFILLFFIKFIILKLTNKTSKYIFISFCWIFVIIFSSIYWIIY